MIDRVMTQEEQVFFDADAQKHPWLKEASMTDSELRARLDGYFYDGYTDKLFTPAWNLHYDKVFAAKLKYFLSTGKYVFYDTDYIDGQTDWVVSQIMKHEGADEDTISEVLIGNAAFKF